MLLLFSKIKIKVAIPLILVGVFFPLGVGLIYLMYVNSVADLKTRTKAGAFNQVSHLALNLNGLGVGNDIEKIQHIISVAGAQSTAQHLSLLDEQGEVLASTNLEWVGQDIKLVWSSFDANHLYQAKQTYATEGLFDEHKQIIQVYHASTLKVAVAGKLRSSVPVFLIGAYSYKSAYKASQYYFWQQTLIYLLVLSLALVLIIWLLSRLISTPVEKLEKFIIDIQQGNYAYMAQPSGSAELVSLSHKLLQMSVEMKKTHTAREEAYAMLRSHLDAVPDLIFFKSLDGTYVDCNQAFCEFVGKQSVEEVKQYKDADLFGSEVAKDIQQKDQSAMLSVEAIQSEEWVKSKCGKKVLLDTLKTPMKNASGETVGLIGISRDVTVKYKLETAIQSLVDSTAGQVGDDFFTAAVKNISQWAGADIVILSELVTPSYAQSLAMIVDGDFVDDFGYDLDGTPCQHVTESGFCSFPQGLVELFPEDEVLKELQVESYVGTPIRNKEGKPVGIFCALSRKANQFSLEVENIMKVLAARASVEIERKRLEINLLQSQKMEAIGTLAGGIAHDFNNTLAGITGNIYLAKRDAEACPKVISRLEGIESLAFSAAEMIQQLLTFSRKDTVSMQHVNLANLLKDIVQVSKVTLPENIRLIQKVEDSKLEINADTKQLQQVVMNLLNNAKDAVAAVDDPQIVLELQRFTADDAFIVKHDLLDSELAHFSVSDNGMGIPSDNLDQVLDPFFTTKQDGRGTGLGLSMVYGSITSHGGIIEIDSQEGVGTTIHCYLPAAHQGFDDGAHHVSVDEVVLGAGETILLVDDNGDVLEVGQGLLEELGYKVVLASNGLEAIEVYQNSPDIALVLLDVVMPKMGGVVAAEKIRSINPQTKIIFLTGYDASQEINAGGENSEYVVLKPFKIERFSQILRQALDENNA